MFARYINIIKCHYYILLYFMSSLYYYDYSSFLEYDCFLQGGSCGCLRPMVMCLSACMAYESVIM